MMEIDVGKDDNSVGEILAISIIKKQKELEKQLKFWKHRAETAEREVECLKSALDQFNCDSSSNIDSLVRILPDLPELPSPSPVNDVGDVLEDMHRHRESLAVFLRNIHALRTAQVFLSVIFWLRCLFVQLLKSKEDHEMWITATTKLVSEFASTSLLDLIPGKLRTAYISHVTKFFQFRLQNLKSSPEKFFDEIQVLVEHTFKSVVEKRTRHEGSDLRQDGGLELLWSLMNLSIAQSCILKSSTDCIFTIVRSQARNASQLFQQNQRDGNVCGAVEPGLVDLVRQLCLLQEKCLEGTLGSIHNPKEIVYLPNEVLEEVVKTSMHAQQFVETLEIICPDLASLLYLSTSLVVAFLHHLSNQRDYNLVEINLERQKCSQLSRNIRDFYMPKTWDLNINEP